MIKGITGGNSVMVTGGYSNYPTFNMNYNNPAIGALRYNPSSQNTETFDGSAWVQISSSYPSIMLADSAERAIAWATKKMEEEAYVLGLSKEYPAVKALLDEHQDIKLKIDMVVALVKQEVKA